MENKEKLRFTFVYDKEELSKDIDKTAQKVLETNIFFKSLLKDAIIYDVVYSMPDTRLYSKKLEGTISHKSFQMEVLAKIGTVFIESINKAHKTSYKRRDVSITFKIAENKVSLEYEITTHMEISRHIGVIEE